MSEEIVFSALDNDLILDVVMNEYGWTSCYLSNGQERIFLGAGCIGYLVTRLIKGLNAQSFSSEMCIEEEKVQWILTLSERHHVLYATIGQTKQRLFWQDGDGNRPKLAGVMTLENEHQEKWLQQLGSLRDKWEKMPQWNYR